LRVFEDRVLWGIVGYENEEVRGKGEETKQGTAAESLVFS
jgi:hypothetical protein